MCFSHLVLWSVRVASFQRSGHHEHGLDGSQTPIVVVLLGQQLLAERVQRDELPGQQPRLQESLRHQHDLTDEFEVRHHLLYTKGLTTFNDIFNDQISFGGIMIV